MALTYMRKLLQTGASLLFADPADITNTFKTKLEMASKYIGKAKVTNCRQTYTSTSTPVTTVGTESGKDNVVITTTISGAVNNQALIDALYARHNVNVAACIASGATKGFTPDSVQIVATQ